MPKRSNNKWLTWVSFVIIFIFLSGLWLWYVQEDRHKRIHLYLTQKIQKLDSEFRTTKHSYDKLFDFFYEELLIDEKFFNLLSQSLVHPNQRRWLYHYLQPRFSILKRFFISYLALFSPEGKPILQMDKFPSSHLTKKDFFTTYKSPLVIEYKKPLYYKASLVATLHLAVSYSILRRELKKLFGGYYDYIVDKSVIDKKVFGYGPHTFIQSDLSPDFFYEREMNSPHTIPPLIHTLNQSIKNKVASLLQTKKSFAVVQKIGEEYYTITFLLIKHPSPIGYLISYKKDPTLFVFDTIFWENLLLGNILVIALLIFFYWVIRSRKKFEAMALTDKLTGLYNRYKFYQMAQAELERAKRNKRPLSIILFDIDHFKKINDTYGHDIGDMVLQEIAQLIQKNIRRYDTLFRWGGEEFLILAPESDIHSSYQLAEKLRTLVASHSFKEVGNVTISLGVAQMNQADKDIDEVIKRADNALYASKANGRNRVTLSD